VEVSLLDVRTELRSGKIRTVTVGLNQTCFPLVQVNDPFALFRRDRPTFPIQRGSAGQRTSDERFWRSLQVQQRDRISRRRRTGQQMVVKGQTVWPDCISKVVGSVTATQQINEFSIVRGREDDVRLHVAAVDDQLGEHRFASGDPLDGVGATK
jgi:hypothetical protein